MRTPGIAAAVAVLCARVAAAGPPPCPGTATVMVYAQNLGPSATVQLVLSGQLLDATATCAGTGATSYATTLTCAGSGTVACGTIPGLAPGAWVDRWTFLVTDPQPAPQVQARRDVFLADAPGTSNFLTWTVYPRTFQVTGATQVELQQRLDDAGRFTAGNPGQQALVTFSPGAFPGAASPRTIPLVQLPPADICPQDGMHAGLCVGGSRIVIDALDATGAPGAVVLSVGTLDRRVIRVYGSDDVLRGLVFQGSQDAVPFSCRLAPSPSCPTQADTVTFVAGAVRDRLEQAIVRGPTAGDAVSVEGVPAAAADVIVAATEISGADDKGLKATDGGHLTLRDSCVHDNRNGGVQSTRGGHITALRNVVEHNLPREAQNGLWAINEFPSVTQASTITTDGNVVRFNGFRGLSVSGNASGTFANDFVSDNGVVGARTETIAQNPTAAAVFHGVALVCNHRNGLTGTCNMSGLVCAGDADCAPGDTCDLASFPAGFGAADAACTVCTSAPQVSYGDPATPGANAFALNPNPFSPANQSGFNFEQLVPDLTVPAEGNQWEQGANGGVCGTMAPRNPDICTVPNATVDVGTPPDPRGGALLLTDVVPTRPHKGELVRVYGSGFDAIDGVACADASRTAPPTTCTGENDDVASVNRSSAYGHHVTVTVGGQTLVAAVWAVTPTMLAFPMPVDCFAAAALTVARQTDAGATTTGTIPLCGPQPCTGQPAGAACNDGDACTAGDRCDGDEVCVAGGPAVCAGACLTGACDPSRGCTPRPAGTRCSAGDACTAGGRCRGDADVCVPGASTVCTSADPCLLAACDAAVGCRFTPAAGFDAIDCRTQGIAQTLAAIGGGGRLGRRLLGLAARVDTAAGAARTAGAGDRRLARRWLAHADAAAVRFLALLRGAPLRRSVLQQLRALAREVRKAIAAQRRTLTAAGVT